MTGKTFSPLLAAAATGIGFFLLGYGGILAGTGEGQVVTVVWPATAFGTCMVLRFSRGRRDDALLLVTVFVAGLLANGATGAPAGINLVYSAVNLVDVIAGVAAARLLGLPRLRGARDTLRFIALVGVAPALLGGGLAGLISALSGNPHWLSSADQWFAANLVGFCMLFPFGMTLSWRQIAKLRLQHRIPEALGTYALVTVVAVLAFRVSPYPMQFLVLMAVLFSAVRFRILGAGIAVMLTGAIALTAPNHFAGADGPARLLMLQLFLAVCSAMSVRASVVLNQRDLQQAIIERRRQRALRAARFKGALLAHVGEEARAPLSAIIGFSSMLESGSLPSVSAQEFAHVIAHNGELLQRLHDDLSDMARAEAGALSIQAQRVALADTLKTCLGAIRLDSALGGKQLVLEEMAEPLTVNADPVRLAQIINNLIAGSYKYGDNHSPIHVRARRLEDGFGRIEIVNQGPGVPLSERDSLFRPFGREKTGPAERSGRQVAGAGLGLSIAKLLVERQGGRIAFASEPGRQTSFWFDLPLSA